MVRIGILENTIQDYAWGSKTAIAELLGQPSPAPNPQAELWMGAHPKAPSLVWQQAQRIPFDQWIATHPRDILGQAVANRFAGRLPFLFKVLAVERPLSIQAHPDRAQAREGFLRENALGIPLSSAQRNYRDTNHKPELVCALTPFWALNGFRTIEQILHLLRPIPGPALDRLASRLEEGGNRHGLQDFFIALLTLTEDPRRQVIREVTHFAATAGSREPAFDWVLRLEAAYPGDVGVLAPLFLNLVQLQPGEAMFLDAGDLHVYLGGCAIELMANSDNVVRGGLTHKHIDLDELLRIVTIREKTLTRITPRQQADGARVYDTPAEEFVLSVIPVTEGRVFSGGGQSVEILLCTEGTVTVKESATATGLEITKGMSVMVPAAVQRYTITGQGMLYKASVPVLQGRGPGAGG